MALMLLLPLLGISQDPFCIKIDGTQGLPSKNVYSLMQDSRGFIWASTDQGLSRYDGQSFKTYTSNSQSSRSGANISEDRYGRIWYQNFDGYCYYVSEDSLHALRQDSVVGFLRAGALGDFWVVPRGLVADCFDLKTLQNRITISLPSNSFMSLFGKNCWWATTEKGNYAVKAKGQIDFEPIAKAGNEGGVIAEWMGQGITVDTRDGLAPIFGLKDGVSRPLASGLITGIVQLTEAAGEELWICGSRGARYLRMENGKVVASKLYFPNYSIGSVAVDREGNHWFGTLGDGILFVQDISSPVLPSDEGAITRVCASHDRLYMGTRTGSLLNLAADAEMLEPFHRFDGGHAIDFLGYDSTSRQLLAGNPLMHTFDESGQEIQLFRVAMKDYVRISTNYYAFSDAMTSGFLRIGEDTLAHVTPWDRVFGTPPNANEPRSRNPVVGRGRAVGYATCSGKLIFGTSNGLVESDGWDNREILYQGNRFFAAEIEPVGDRLLLRSTIGALRWLDCAHGFVPARGIDALGPIVGLRVSDATILIMTQSGIHKAQARGDSLVVAQTLLHINPLLVNDFAAWGDQLAVATDDGMLLVQVEADKPVTPPSFVITGLRIHGQRFAANAPATVPADHNDLEISYSVLSFGSGANYPVYYRVNNGPWEAIPAASRSLQFASLSPKDYVIEFCLNQPCEEIAGTVYVTIRKPFWMRVWFWVGCIFLLLMGIAAIIQGRFRLNARKQQRKLQQLELEKNLNHSMLTALRSQMNPHFFFNALNTIQSYIYANEKKNAADYLAKFSQLTRMVLAMSSREMVSLRDEVQSLQLYLELEKARFEESMEFNIELQPGLELDNTQLPSMIVQPICENALKHGLLHRKGERWLLLRFYKEDDKLVIVVDDNGIGRKRSAELNRIRSEQHQSFATLATAKRIALLNAAQHDIHVEYIDKVGPDGQAEGTTVVLTIKLKNETSYE